VLLRTHGGIVARGLFQLRPPGYRVFPVEDLLKRGYPGRGGGDIYAVFEVVEDRVYADQEWYGAALIQLIEVFEARRKHRENIPLGPTSSDPRVLSLRDLLKALK
jgi:hypothetical protein